MKTRRYDDADPLNTRTLEIRNRTLGYAKRACTLEEAAQGDSLWSYLDTLALAQHTAGNSASAATTQRRAMSLLPQDHPERSDVQKRLTEYESAAPAASN